MYKSKKLMRVLFTTVLLTFLFSLSTVAYGMEGEGTQENPYLIYTKEDLESIDGTGYNKLMNDIDLDGKVYEHHVIKTLSGSFDGQGYSISNLTINTIKGKKVNTGFINTATSNATIKNLNLKNINIDSKWNYVGGLVGFAEDIVIDNCTVEGTIHATLGTVGLLVGEMEAGLITNCSTTGFIYDTQDPLYYAPFSFGGIAGKTGKVKIDYCSSNITITGNELLYNAGGIVGNASGPISNCYTIINLEGDRFLGGIAGYTNYNANINNCYSIGTIKGSGIMGGITTSGPTQFPTTNCFSIVNLVGMNYKPTTWPVNMFGVGLTVDYCYSASTMTIIADGTEEKVHKTFGVGSGVANSYYDAIRSEPGENINGAKTTGEMLSQATYEGWDFENTWGIFEGESYPYLKNLPIPDEIFVNGENLDIPVETITILPTELMMDVGETLELICTITPENASNQHITYSSSDDTIAVVGKDGIVTALSEGTAIITARTNNQLTAICELIVIDTVEEGIEIIVSDYLLEVGETTELEVIWLSTGEPVTDKISWIIDTRYRDIVSVNTKGLLTAKSEGEAIVKCSVTVNGIKYIDSVSITVIGNDDEKDEDEGIKIIAPEYPLEIGETIDLDVVWLSTEESVGKPNWTMDPWDSSIVSINTKNVLTAKAEGTALVKCTITVDGVRYTDAILITVVGNPPEPEPYYIDLEQNVLFVDDSIILNAIRTSDNEIMDNVVWVDAMSQDIVSIRNDILTANAAGTAYIKGKVVDDEIITYVYALIIVVNP